MNEKLRTRYDFHHKTGPEDYTGHTTKVNRAAFVPITRLIDSYMAAGKRLTQSREQFDIDNTINPEDAPDDMLDQGMDKTDAHLALLQAREKRKFDAMMAKREADLVQMEKDTSKVQPASSKDFDKTGGVVDTAPKKD